MMQRLDRLDRLALVLLLAWLALVLVRLAVAARRFPPDDDADLPRRPPDPPRHEPEVDAWLKERARVAG